MGERISRFVRLVLILLVCVLLVLLAGYLLPTAPVSGGGL